MVERFDARGRHYREAAYYLSEKKRMQFRRLIFPLSPEGDVEQPEIKALEELQTLPVFDRQSVLVSNVYDSNGKTVHVLLVPSNCSGLRPKKELPPENNEPYIVHAVGMRDRVSTDIPILVKDLEAALAVGRRVASQKLNVHRKYIEIDAEKVVREDFVQLVKKMLDKRVFVPRHIIDYCNLGEHPRTSMPPRNLNP